MYIMSMPFSTQKLLFKGFIKPFRSMICYLIQVPCTSTSTMYQYDAGYFSHEKRTRFMKLQKQMEHTLPCHLMDKDCKVSGDKIFQLYRASSKTRTQDSSLREQSSGMTCHLPKESKRKNMKIKCLTEWLIVT